MSKPMQPKSLEAFIVSFLNKNQIRLEQHTFDYHYGTLTRKQFAKQLAESVYTNRSKIFDFNGDKAQ